jgi:hypothetical protein
MIFVKYCSVCDNQISDNSKYMYQRIGAYIICMDCWKMNTDHLNYEYLTGVEKDRCCLPECPDHENQLLCFNIYEVFQDQYNNTIQCRIAFCSKCYDKEIGLY